MRTIFLTPAQYDNIDFRFNPSNAFKVDTHYVIDTECLLCAQTGLICGGCPFADRVGAGCTLFIEEMLGDKDYKIFYELVNVSASRISWLVSNDIAVRNLFVKLRREASKCIALREGFVNHIRHLFNKIRNKLNI